jgi:HEAT repeat protein
VSGPTQVYVGPQETRLVWCICQDCWQHHLPLAAEADAKFRSENSVQDLCAVLRDGDETARREAAEKLGRLGDKRAVPELIADLAREERPNVETIWALGKIGGDEARTALMAELGTARAWDRVDYSDMTLPSMAETRIATALVTIGGSRTLLDALGAVMTSQANDRFIRAEAAGELAKIAWRASVGHGLTIDRDSPSLTPADRTLMAGPLISALRDEFWMVREDAVSALGLLGDSDVLPSLIAKLDDEHDRVRYFTARALGDLGDPRAVQPLRRAMRKHPTIEVAAKKALAKLTAG